MNLTHNEDSSVDLYVKWDINNCCNIVLRHNCDDQEDVIISCLLTREELEHFANYLDQVLE